MDRTRYRVGVVGASSMAGKDLSEELAESQLATAEIILLDEEDAAGLVTSAGEEASFIQRLDSSSFEGLDFVFFAGSAELTERQWQNARRGDASIVDLTYALEDTPGVLLRAPWIGEADLSRAPAPDLETPAVVSAHPAAIMLALTASRLRSKLPLLSVAATVLQPASEHGRAAMDELHQQTVSLLAFHDLPQDQYDAQVAFNLLARYGEEARSRLEDAEARILRHYATISGGSLPELALQLVHAPVFHGYTASVLVEFGEEIELGSVERLLADGHIELVSREGDLPSNLSAAGQKSLLMSVRSSGKDAERSRRFWIWMAADNLKVAALNGIACAAELRRLRPRGKVQ